ncbi:hypothetical protein CN326_20365 [Bacillus sp. AFS018417]|uniref:hypothetical protein n=1 Tax=unclassified Bacillus (in: firmicutes) TaxID=185979 RepID=UPI000BF7CCFB|nr:MULTISPECIES: hypothetical protein [unclassified Bacillus (in: firmicutes)]MCP1124225.1 hypothetical protein [Bacillus sp. 3103sda1]PEZ02233.1 hypothetical protein CN326_20365 [Bacillus sp. AFS018417]
MNLKKISIASLAIGAMLSITACGTSTEKDQANQSKKEQTNAQEEAKTTSADQTNTSKNEEKDSKTTSADGKTEATSTNTEQTKNEKNGTKETKSTNAKQNASMKSGVTEVVQLIEEVDKQLKANPKQETVNKLGKQIADKWDVVEKEVETKHPSDYKTIEQNLYPLIVEMEKQKQDLKKLKTLTTKTKQDLNQFLNKL